MSTRRVVLVGLGYAGQRFARVLHEVAAEARTPVEVVGVVDRRQVPSGELPVFTSLSDALVELRPDTVCVTVNERAHEAVFDELADAATDRLTILSEKPLTADAASAHRVARRLAGHRFSMNLVERYSPLVTTYHEWAAGQPDLSVIRVESHWGKHRVFDPRPTMGVLSELIHPLDLVQHLFLPLSGASIRAHGVASDFDESRTDRLDSLNVALDAGGVPVLLNTSFAWPRRVRTVTTLVRAGSWLYSVLLTFDDPHWDNDRIRIVRIDPDGRYTVVLEEETDAVALPTSLAGVHKLATFVRRSLGFEPDSSPAAAAITGRSDTLVDLTDAVVLQDLLEAIRDAADEATLRAAYRPVGCTP